MDDDLLKDLIEVRHYLHAHPELSNQEFETTKFLKKEVQEIGLEILESDLETGFVAKLGRARPVIALRTDIDALPIQEKTGLDFSSQNPGVMQACGHDLHMTALLGAARLLKARESEISGTIKFIFQPAEELGLGAERVIRTGILDDVEAFVGFHNMPTLGAGVIGLREKGVMASVDRFAVELKGHASHAAYPQDGIDPILAQAAIIQNLQSIVSRNVSPMDSAVLSVTHVTSGQTWNIIPESAFFEGTIRTFDEEVRSKIKKRFEEVIQHSALALGLEVEISWPSGADVTFNDPELTQFLRELTGKWYDQVIIQDPSSVGEDFAFYRRLAPSVFAFIGSNNPGAAELHQQDFRLLDEVIPVAVNYFVNSAFGLLDHLRK